MKIVINSISVDTQSINPALQLDIAVEYVDEIEAPFLISGAIVSSGKIISTIEQVQIINQQQYDLVVFDQKTRNTRIDGGSKYKTRATFKLISILSTKALDYLEESRNKHFEKSVNLQIDFVLMSISLPYKPVGAGGPQTGDELLKIKQEKVFENYVIKQSDWVNHFSTQLGIGKFLLLELMILDKVVNSRYWIELYDNLAKNLEDTETALKNGDWYHAMFHLRRFYENIKVGDNKPGSKNFKEELSYVLGEDNHSEIGKDNFYSALWNLFDFFSKYVHEKDQVGNPQPKPIARKEDAYFGYSVGIGLLNLIGRKLNRK